MPTTVGTACVSAIWKHGAKQIRDTSHIPLHTPGFWHAEEHTRPTEKAVTRMAYRSHPRNESNDESGGKSAPKSQSASDKTAMDRLKRAVDRLNSLSESDSDSEHESANQEKAVEPESRPTNALADFLNDEEEPAPAPEAEQSAEEDAAPSSDLGEAIGKMGSEHDTLHQPEPSTADEHPQESERPDSMFEIATRQGGNAGTAPPDDAPPDAATP